MDVDLAGSDLSESGTQMRHESLLGEAGSDSCGCPSVLGHLLRHGVPLVV
jgi:hypothetical protein